MPIEQQTLCAGADRAAPRSRFGTALLRMPADAGKRFAEVGEAMRPSSLSAGVHRTEAGIAVRGRRLAVQSRPLAAAVVPLGQNGASRLLTYLVVKPLKPDDKLYIGQVLPAAEP
eukprot:6199770-Pleurochrysis_carterae.AAC.3